MECAHVYQRMLFHVSILYLVVFNSALLECIAATATTLSPDNSPNLQPVPSPSSQPKSDLSPSPTTNHPLNYVSFPPSASDPPSESISPSSSDLNYGSFPPSASDPPSESISPSLFELDDVLLPPSASDPPIEPTSASAIEFDDVTLPPSASDPSLESKSEVPRKRASVDNIATFMTNLHSMHSTDISSDNVHPQIKKICDATDYPALCLSTIVPLLNNGKTDVVSVLQIAIKASKELARFVFNMSEKLAQNPRTPKDIVTILQHCHDSYDSVLDNYQKAVDALSTHDIGTLNTMLSAAITDAGDCEDEFSEFNHPSPMSKFAEKLTNMTSNCLAIVSLITN